MCISEMLEILNAFKRFLDFENANGYDETIRYVEDNFHTLLIGMVGHNGEKYEVEVYIDGVTGSLAIENTTNHVNIIEFIDWNEYELSSEFQTMEEQINYIRYGRKEGK